MNFCDCGNILVPIVAIADAYFECSMCKKRRPFGAGDTLIRVPIIKPTGEEKHAHVLRYLSKKNTFALVDDTPCPACNNKTARIYIAESTWYGCIKCHHVYTNPAPILGES